MHASGVAASNAVFSDQRVRDVTAGMLGWLLAKKRGDLLEFAERQVVNVHGFLQLGMLLLQRVRVGV